MGNGFMFHGRPHDYPSPTKIRVTERQYKELSSDEYRAWWFGGRAPKPKFAIADFVRVLHRDEMPSDRHSVSGAFFEFGPPAPEYGVVVGISARGSAVVYEIGEAKDDPNDPRKIAERVEECRLVLINTPAPSQPVER